MFYAGGARVLSASVVIAAWGEGVNVCLCPPSPSSDRSSSAQSGRKYETPAGVLGHAHTRHVHPAPPHLISKKGQKCFFGGPLDFPTHVCNSAHPLVYIIGLTKKF
jgi:hypothetical protein